MKEIRYIGLAETFEECAIKEYYNSLDSIEYRQRMMGINKNIGNLKFMSDSNTMIMKRYYIKYQMPLNKRSHNKFTLFGKS